MKEAAAHLRDLPFTIATAPEAETVWARSPLSALSDAALVSAVAAAIAAPKREADTSFLTHAPLELLARAALLPVVEPKAREAARRRIAAIAADYAKAGEEVPCPCAPGFGDGAAALDALHDALNDGDVETADAAAQALCDLLPPSAISDALAAHAAQQLGAAGHAPILLAEFVRAEGRIDGLGPLLRAPARAMARERVALRWQMNCSAAAFAGDRERELMRRLAAAPSVFSPSPYIAPTMLAVEADGFAESVLGDVTADLPLDAARRALLRIAALSMLQDDPDAAPYGWTHALTMPLAALAVAGRAADQLGMIRVAATHSLGFRSTMGKVRLDLDWRPERIASAKLHDGSPSEAAAAAYHWPADDRGRLRSILATRAATHEDAHLAKYTLACFDAAGADPEEAALHLAAAACLGAWWDAHPGVRFE